MRSTNSRSLLAATVLIAASMAGVLGAITPAWPDGAAAEESQAPSSETSLADMDYQAIQQASTPVTDAAPDEVQQRVEQTATTYNDAVAARQDLEEQIAQNQELVASLEAQLPELREKAALAMVATYKTEQGPGLLLEAIFSSQDFSTLISRLVYFNAVQQSNNDQINELLDAERQLAETQAELSAQLEEAKVKEQEAQQALSDAQEARQQALEAARQAAAEQEAALAQAQTTQQAQAGTEVTAAQSGTEAAAQTEPTAGTDSTDQPTQAATPATGEVTEEVPTETAPVEEAPIEEDPIEEAPVEEPVEAPVEEPVEEPPVEEEVSLVSERDSFIASWSGRIDAYLSGSPLAGQGATFAAAAWDYGVDPRISPAISCVESSRGAYCFLPYNAWGWGSYSWGSWEEAIYAHVAGFARGYGSSLDYSDAESYCPTNPGYWYSSVLSQMERI